MSLVPTLPDTQFALAISIFFGTFVYEDGATLAAATLSASGRLNPGLGLAAAFLGIWVGDIGLYAVGSTFRRFTTSSRLQPYLRPGSLGKAQAWFAQRGSLALVMSRAIPGSRLPLYLAAGTLRLPLRKFARITGICAAAWVSAIFSVWRFVPALWPGAGKLAPSLLTAFMLLFPWLIGKTLKSRITKTGERAASQGVLDPCAL